MMMKVRYGPKYNRYLDIELNVTSFNLESKELFVESIYKAEERWISRTKHISTNKFMQENAFMWIKIPVRYSYTLPEILGYGFKIHHATEDYIMTIKSANGNIRSLNIPSYDTHYIRIECIVLNENNEILMVQELYDTKNQWKLVTGTLDAGEYIVDGAKREIKEETGVITSFGSLLGIGNRLRTRFGKDEL